MELKIRRKGIKDYKEMNDDKPSEFEIWWYGHQVYKIGWGFILGCIVCIILRGFA